MKTKTFYSFDPQTGMAKCTIRIPGIIDFVGVAKCCNNDFDFLSEKVGCEIAERRAQLKLYKWDLHEIRARQSSLISFVNRNKLSTKDKEKILAEIAEYQKNIDFIKSNIDFSIYDLKEYLAQKEEFYQKIRKNRKRKAEMDKI